MIWRMLADDPVFDTNNYHGEAETPLGTAARGREREAGVHAVPQRQC